jgi:hypothetical protein
MSIENILKYVNSASRKDWDLVEVDISNGTLEKDSLSSVFIDQLINKNAPLEYIKKLCEYNTVEHIKNKEFFKWACAYANLETVKYFNGFCLNNDIEGAMTAAIVNYRPNVVQYLIDNHQGVLKIHNFSLAISRSQANKEFGIIDIYLKNIDKFVDFNSDYIKIIKQSWLCHYLNILATNDISVVDIQKKAVEIIKVLEVRILKDTLENDLSNVSSNAKKGLKI